MRFAIAILACVLMAGCATTAEDLTAQKPAVLRTTRSVAAYAGCVAPRLQKLWPFVHAIPIDGGQQITGSGSMAIPKVMVAIDITANGNGTKVAYFLKNASVQSADVDVIRGCV